MSSRPRGITVWASLILTALTAACGSPNGPVLPPCTLDQLGMIDSGQCDAPVVVQAHAAAR